MSVNLLSPGLPILLQVPKLENRVNLHVIGWEIPQFLITNLPYVNEKPINLKLNEACIIRFLKDEHAYGFQTSVLSMQFFPAPLIFFRYPQKVDQIAFRKSKRFRLNIPAKLLDPRTVETVDVEISDISETGCRLKLPLQPEEAYKTGQNFYLSFTMLDKSVEADCLLRNVRAVDDALYLGMEFAGLATATRTAIQSFVTMLSKAF